MIEKTGVSKRVGMLPAIAVLWFAGSLATVNAQNAVSAQAVAAATAQVAEPTVAAVAAQTETPSGHPLSPPNVVPEPHPQSQPIDAAATPAASDQQPAPASAAVVPAGASPIETGTTTPYVSVNPAPSQPPAAIDAAPGPSVIEQAPAAAALDAQPEPQAHPAAVAAPTPPVTASELPAVAAQPVAAPPVANAAVDAVAPAAPAAAPSTSAAVAPVPVPEPDHQPAAAPADGAAPAATAAIAVPTPGEALSDSTAQVLPPADSVVAAIRTKLSSLSQTLTNDEREALSNYYGQMTGTALWASPTGLTAKGKAVVSEIGRAENWGLPGEAFSVPSIGISELTPEAAADAELQVSTAVLLYARYARGGRINPRNISQLMDQSPDLVAPATVLSEVAATGSPDVYLTSMHPPHPQFEALRKKLLELRGVDGKEHDEPEVDPALTVKLPPGRLLRLGVTDDQVSLVRQRLKVPADDPADENVFDESVRNAVLEFQRSNNLAADGLVGNGTRQVLNGGTAPPRASAESTIQRILINMERWRWVPRDMGEFHVWDNVPEYLTRVVKNGQVVLRDEIVVGQPSWPTPVFSADMKTIVFRPSWGVPNGIKTKELGPLLRKSNSGGGGLFGLFGGGGYSAQAVLDAHDLQAYQNGRRIDPNSVNWASVDIRAYHFTQPPGPKNVLGEVKFMFPNKHDVYMHDTPQRNLFAKSYRALSHGCLRVHHPRRFAEVLLEQDKGWSSSQVGNMFSRGGEIALSTHIPVHITYMTARVDDNGKLHTFGDFYGLDSRTAAALTGRSIRFEQQPADLEAIAEAEGRPQPQQQQRKQQRKQQYSNSSPNSLSDVIQGLFSP
ncbi:hypothetical protein APY04_1003 [Hyphomicrobium sulfonivorans]|uniref:L,D-TPase catalytic domain-containing protein n=1 Tax=Hyphomicrobium sulfonivorans TaxID=121290 RepID=A0A109BK65_HYPSL|nr:L,D-transpeptidase family protein [Hyphomicrobium sulfonivorans]KWT70326.1 hypothetical protein APY04_1003 [Hyphomicrobium sulfonivorans]